jgi:hypothetical protein
LKQVRWLTFVGLYIYIYIKNMFITPICLITIFLNNERMSLHDRYDILSRGNWRLLGEILLKVIIKHTEQTRSSRKQYPYQRRTSRTRVTSEHMPSNRQFPLLNISYLSCRDIRSLFKNIVIKQIGVINMFYIYIYIYIYIYTVRQKVSTTWLVSIISFLIMNLFRITNVCPYTTGMIYWAEETDGCLAYVPTWHVFWKFDVDMDIVFWMFLSVLCV